MNYYNERSDGPGRSSYDQWRENSPRSFRPQSYDAALDELQRWKSLNERMDSGRNDIPPPPLYAARSGSSNSKHLSSSNQINTSLFNSYGSPSNTSRMNNSYSSLYSSRAADLPHPSSDYYKSTQSGRINRNKLTEITKAKRILQKRALSSIATNRAVVSSLAVKRKRGPRFRKSQKPTTPTTTTANDSKNTKVEKSDKDAKSEAQDKTKTDKVPPEMRIAINWINDTKTNITPEQAALITAQLEKLLDEIPVEEGVHIPKFYASGLSIGVYKFVCADQQTVDWVKNAVANFPELWEGANLNVIQQSEINSLVLVTLTLIDNDADLITLLRRIEKQNPEVNIEQWRLHHESKEGKERIIVLAVDRESFDYLKKNDFKLFLGLRRVRLTAGFTKTNK